MEVSVQDSRRDVPVSSTTDAGGREHRPNGDTGRMGFDPQRPRRRRPSDIAYVVAVLVVGTLLVLWALVG